MITPYDIETKEFKKSHRGYDEQEVDEFLDQIIVDMEGLIKENKELKAKLSSGAPEDENSKETGKSVYETLEAAKALMNDISLSAERRAEVLLKNAELDADLITREAKESVQRYTDEGAKLKQRVENLRDRYKKMLEDELQKIDYYTEDIIQDFEKDFLNAKTFTNAQTSTTQKQKIDVEKIDMTKTMVMPKAGK